jgi:hypothetical protein
MADADADLEARLDNLRRQWIVSRGLGGGRGRRLKGRSHIIRVVHISYNAV